MCRSIKTLHRAEEPATETEIHEAALQFVRKISGYRAPSKANAAAFERATADVEATVARLLAELEPRKVRTGEIPVRDG